jgi:hypothetical protein
MDWLNNIPSRINEDGYLQLIPENSEEKSVIDIAPAFEKVSERMIANKFKGVLD